MPRDISPPHHVDPRLLPPFEPDPPGTPARQVLGLAQFFDRMDDELLSDVPPPEFHRRHVLAAADRTCDLLEAAVLRLRREIRGGYRPPFQTHAPTEDPPCSPTKPSAKS